MTLQEAAVEFFKAIQEVGRADLGHDEFGFKVDIAFMVKNEDSAKATAIHAQIQAALNIANNSIKPLSTSLQ